MTTKTYKDGQPIGKATHCIFCKEPLEDGIEGDACRDYSACILRMRDIELEGDCKF